MLSGSEETLRRRALHEAIAEAGLQPGDFDLASLEGSTPPNEWVGQAATYPFLAEKRVVVVRHLLRAEPDPKAGFDQLPETALLILVADEELGDESRQSRLKTIKTNWEKLVNTSGGRVESFEVNPKSLLHDLRAESNRLGKALSEHSAELLAEMVGGSLSRGFEELEKLSLYVGDEPAIREQDIKTLVVPAREWNVFKLVDAVVRNEMADALRQLKVLVGSAHKAEEAAFRSILPQLSRQLRLLWQGRICLDKRVSPENVPHEIAALFPNKPNLAKEAPYRQRAVMNAARSADFPRLTRCFQILSDADARLKGLLPGVSGFETLERMVLEMAAEFAR
jgi:DNA polymerase-3 subunit delta